MNPAYHRSAQRRGPEDRSYTGRAFLLIPLYLLGYLPGFICNVVWYRQVRWARQVTGRKPPGYGCLHVLMAVGVAPLLLLILLWLTAPPHILWPPEGASVRSETSRARSDMRSIGLALEAYRADHGSYPAYTFDRRESIDPGSAAEFERVHGRIPTLRARAGTQLATLTTPTPYLTEPFPADRFLERQFRNSTYAYWTDGDGWIIWSPGPDGKYTITGPETLYSSAIAQPSELLLITFTYDPTNGTVSPGDLWRVWH